MKVCRKCNSNKLLSDYYKAPSCRDGHRGECKACSTYIPKTPEQSHKAQIKHRYGISIEEYNQFFLDQDGKCFICQRHQSQFTYKLVVDHCHITKIVRGLLCRQCNSAIGLLKDDPNLVARALYWLL